jgi:dipeptidyl aminopeptidase/acylaminoacyl peptidase
VLERQSDATGSLGRGWQALVKGPAYGMPWLLEGRDDQGRIYVSVAQPGGDVLKRLDPVRKVPEDQPLLTAPGFDFQGHLIRDPDGGPLLGVRATADAETTAWFEPTLAAVQKAIDTRLPDRVNRLVCRNCRRADRIVLVISYADRHPGELWLWRGEPDKPSAWRRIGVKRPAIDPNRMATVDLMRFKARDGREIPLWVTLPAEPSAAGPAPAVLLAHGGPWMRGGQWQWDPLAQFIASRGYVVLMPEFRGSMGYGDAHFRAGFKQWGRAMQDDLADAVAWAVARKLVDPARVCIGGGSYGGYAALMGLVKQADVFRCGAAFAAVTEPFWLLREGSPDIRSNQVSAYTMPQMLGDSMADRDLLREASPLQHAARIRGPLLLGWGEEDRRVPPEHSQRMSAALKNAGIAHEAVSYEGEGHSWLKTATWVDFAGRLEKLLARELRGTPTKPAN